MSSASIISNLNFATQHVYIYFGLFIVITGMFGQFFNIIVFTTLKTFRETTCGFYLTIVSIFNAGQLLSVLLRILQYLNSNLTDSAALCKFRNFFTQFCALVSFTAMCLTTIDQFLSMTKYRYWNTMQSARRHVIFACIIWFIHGCFALVYFDSSQNTCIMTNAIYSKYYAYVYLLILLGILPLTIISIFSLLAFFKIRSTASREMNIIRLSRDRQLTAMTLVHVLFLIITTLPFVIFYTYTLSINVTDQQVLARNRLILAVTSSFGYEGYAVSYLHHSLIPQ